MHTAHTIYICQYTSLLFGLSSITGRLLFLFSYNSIFKGVVFSICLCKQDNGKAHPTSVSEKVQVHKNVASHQIFTLLGRKSESSTVKISIFINGSSQHLFDIIF